MRIPIIGNGDITQAQGAVEAFDRYGVDAVMIGRATFGRPWIFKEVHDALHGEGHDVDTVVPSRFAPMSADWKLDVLKEQVRQSVERIGEYRGIINYWGVEDTGIVTAKIDEQKTDATRAKILQLVEKL